MMLSFCSDASDVVPSMNSDVTAVEIHENKPLPQLTPWMDHSVKSLSEGTRLAKARGKMMQELILHLC